MIKIFPKSRICVIDCQSSFQKGLRTALIFCKRHNITTSSSDGKKIILSFCLKDIEETYKTTNTQYPKVLCLSKNEMTKKMETFIDQYFDKMMSYAPFPYCGKFNLNSPDLETAAENSLKQQKSTKKYKQLKAKLNLRSVD